MNIGRVVRVSGAFGVSGLCVGTRVCLMSVNLRDRVPFLFL